jgi:ABC-type oligopeptide transport system substrate-binding subunit
VELLFESLVSLTPDERGLLYYRPALADGRPAVQRLGREFKLPRNARWSDGAALTVNDLRFTVKQLRDGKRVGRPPVWGEMLDDPRTHRDSLRVTLRLKQGLLEPLAAMSFKLLPARAGLMHPAEKAFAEKPVSSGPFAYAGQKTEELTKRSYASFSANQYYGVRPGRLNQPRIREVRLFPVLDPVKELREGKLDLALDLTADQAAQLRAVPNVEVPLPTERTANRRIYFLAVNNRKRGLDRADVRVALARAIEREPLLEKHFRKALGGEVHKALNGPYPAGSWACDPKLASADKKSLDPFDPDLAQAKFKEGTEKHGKPDELTLKYPAGDPAAEEAMKELCRQVMQVLPGLVLRPVARPPHELRSEVEETHNYDLAYYHHDYADELFWLMPLLGASGPGGGPNYLGYTGPLVAKIQAADSRRDFQHVREHVHAIHGEFLGAEMPFIPLWQLDPLYAYRRDALELPGPIDPQLIFTRVEEWTVKRANNR